MIDRFTAIVANKHDGGSIAAPRELCLADLPDDDVLVEVAYSTLNYKDGLALTGASPICRFFPMVCGIDLAGTVVESKNQQFHAGDKVIVNGFGLSESHWGGYSQKMRVRAEWLVRKPDEFTLEQTMAIGTAGYTAMLCVQSLLEHGTQPGDGPVIVTGASGGVGSVAVMLLSRMGFDVVAATGRAKENESFLKALGARKLVERDELNRKSKALESERWAGGVDCVGGDMLATVIAQTRYGGAVTACGLAGSPKLSTTMMPFILRGVQLRGIDSVMAPLEARQRAWEKLGKTVNLDLLASIYRVEPMSNVVDLGGELLAGKVRGRIVIDVNA
ncbi:MAG: oxidoreductase [Gammaproteobacteria bacterium]|nr:oxidoreductase [Gammaproteobacteria bacterium]